MSIGLCAASRPGTNELDGLRDHAKTLRAFEVTRRLRNLWARMTRDTRDAIDPRIHPDRAAPPRRYSWAYF
jgi:hypothetical protein